MHHNNEEGQSQQNSFVIPSASQRRHSSVQEQDSAREEIMQIRKNSDSFFMNALRDLSSLKDIPNAGGGSNKLSNPHIDVALINLSV